MTVSGPPPEVSASRTRIFAVLTFLSVLVVLVPPAFGFAPEASTNGAAGEESVTLVVFWLDGCPHCEAERRFLEPLVDEHAGLVVDAYELHDASSQERFRQAGQASLAAGCGPASLEYGRRW
jgi:thiol-disulfide isomerase/thioredoxin